MTTFFFNVLAVCGVIFTLFGLVIFMIICAGIIKMLIEDWKEMREKK